MKVFLNCLSTFFIVSFFSYSASGQQLNASWEADLDQALQKFVAYNDNTCHSYHGKNLETVYKINDFYALEKQEYMTIAEINDFLKASGKWEKLGPAYDDKALAKAQEAANSKKATVAMYLDDSGLGHIALILPGDLTPSGSWGIQVPNSASFLLNNPSKSYVGKSLSYAFLRSQLKNVVLYSRKY